MFSYINSTYKWILNTISAHSFVFRQNEKKRKREKESNKYPFSRIFHVLEQTHSTDYELTHSAIDLYKYY